MKNFTPTLVFLFVLCMHFPMMSQEQENYNQPGIEFLNQDELENFNSLDISQKSSDVEENYEPLAPIEYTYNGGWSPSNPIGLATSIDTIVLESGTVNITANTVCDNLIVKPGAALIVEAGITLTTASIDLESTSSAYSSLISNGTVVGLVNYHRYTAQIGTNDLISSPVSNQVFDAFAVINTGVLAASGNLRAFAPYVTTSGAYQNYNTLTNALTTIDSGIGYRAATVSGSNLTFSGTVTTGDVLDVSISDAAAGGGWNLVGNPYPSYIDFDTFFALNKNQLDNTSYQAIYGYDGNAQDGWTVWNQATIDSPIVTELIAPGQAFFIKSKTGGGSIDFTADMRCVGSSDDFITGRTQSPHHGYMKLNVSSNTNNFETDFYFNSNASRGFDSGYDAALYGQNAPSFSVYSQLVENNTGIPFAIQALNPESMYDVVIPLGLNATQGQEVTISMVAGDIPDEISIYLEDTSNNTFTLLNTNDYTFIVDEDLTDVGRFNIRFEGDILGTKESNLEELDIYANNNDKTIVINGQLQNDSETKLYDVNGRLVLSTSLNSNDVKQVIDVNHLTAGIYIIEIGNETIGKQLKKLILK